MGIESSARAWAHRHGPQNGRDLTLHPAVHHGGFEALEPDALLPRVAADALVWASSVEGKR